MTNVDPYKEEPFTYAPSDLSKRNYVNQTKTGAVHINYEERDISKARNQSISIGKQMLPLINTTLIDQILQSTIKQENELLDELQAKIKDLSENKEKWRLKAEHYQRRAEELRVAVY